MVERFVSEPIDLPPRDAALTRADVIFYGVDHSGSSYEARVFFGAADADVTTSRDDDAFAGAFHVFGHGGCFGDVGHCGVPNDPQDPFDLRPAHQLVPQTKVVIVTSAVTRVLAANASEHLLVTVVAETPGDRSNEVLAFDRVRLLTYK